MILWLPMNWMASGVCLFAGAHFLRTGRSREHDQLYLAFGVLSLVVAAYLVGMALLQEPHTRLSIVNLERLHLSIACIIYPVAVWFVALYSRMRRWKPFLAMCATVFGVLFVANLVRPFGLLHQHISDLPPLQLPWGEEVRQFGGPSSVLAPIYFLCTLGIFGWAFWRCHSLWRSSDRRRAWPLCLYLLLQLAAVIHSEYSTYMQRPMLDWDALPFLGLVLLLSRSLTQELRQYEQDLRRSNLALREENQARERAQTYLEHAAFHDALTGLPNRRALRDSIQASLGREPSGYAALIILDPERLRVVNQALGYHLGDELLRELARRLSQAADGTHIIARLDGDEFAVLLEDLPAARETARQRAREMATSLQQELAAGVRLGSHDLTGKVSAGVTLIENSEVDGGKPMREAYMALQAAKKSAASRVMMFADDMQTGTERELRLENDLRLAIRDAELQMHFQPQSDAKGRLVGAEALLRWQHPEFGDIEPQEFVRIAEDRGLIDVLGQIALTMACEALASLGPMADGFRLSVNISPWQLLQADFPAMVRRTLADTGIAPHRLTLEITESVFVQDVTDAIAKIHELKADGLRVSIDDFGTGFASVASLRDLPVGEMKIDRSFVQDMGTAAPDRFVTAMIALGHALDLNIVAEGVETESQRASLAAMGCHVFQGFLIGRPRGLEDLRSLLDA